ncbi:CHAT domain-containing protein [Saccharothrix syringae]|uniref:CHAT domain-containing protein n=1 Tax=Saccharothrix syringae TaxID=103733 RepID=A0A5Q0H314_SACSY|nr:CHAT domain-containing protein [Saccharothrix syringae]QFZ20596.1 CHAT domain-containing protein [Saccharothrix syringae]
MAVEVPDESRRLVDRRMALAREWDELVGRVRDIPGFADFLRPPRPAGLLPATRGGPVVAVNVSVTRCDALVVRADGVSDVPLPDLTAADVEHRVRGYLAVSVGVEDAARALASARREVERGEGGRAAVVRYDAAKRGYLAAREAMELGLLKVAAWLWDVVAGPVLAELGFTEVADVPPRLWWCPTGLLSLLPLHAAGHHVEGRAVLDRVVSSYTPTLRALLDANRPVGDVDRRMLVVALPEREGQPPLPAVNRERDLLTRLFADRTLLEGADATWDAVRAALPGHGWVHFSCHGGQDLARPSSGGLLLHDRVLTVGDIGAARYQGEFVFLSACKTAMGGFRLADEAITLTAALHYTGYRHVVGTLWSVYDTTAATVAESVYTELTASGRFEPERSARALHDAVRAVRAAGGPPSAWMPFTHTGP